MQARPRWPGLTQSVLLGTLTFPLGALVLWTAVDEIGWPPGDLRGLAYLVLWTVVVAGACCYAAGRAAAHARRRPFVVVETDDGPVLRVRKVSRLPITLAAAAAAAICVLAFPEHAGDTAESGRAAGIPLGIPMTIVIGLAVATLARWPAVRPYFQVTTSGIALMNGRDGFACPFDELVGLDQEDQVDHRGLVDRRSPSMQVHVARGGGQKTYSLDPAAFHGDTHELLRLVARLAEAGSAEQRAALIREAPCLSDG